MQVPVLTEETAELLPNQCLVRFRGMVSCAGLPPRPLYRDGGMTLASG
jgi:hypothetical protein